MIVSYCWLIWDLFGSRFRSGLRSDIQSGMLIHFQDVTSFVQARQLASDIENSLKFSPELGSSLKSGSSLDDSLRILSDLTLILLKTPRVSR